jgi:4-aminobutyrate aminotransferase-like enzyme
MSAAQAVLDILRDEGLIVNARVVGDYLTAGLDVLAGVHNLLGEVRADAPGEKSTLVVVNELRLRAVLVGASGAASHTLKIRPPLCISLNDADRFLCEFDSARRVARTMRVD